MLSCKMNAYQKLNSVNISYGPTEYSGLGLELYSGTDQETLSNDFESCAFVL